MSQSERSFRYSDPIGDHYSKKGGHKARHDFQWQIRKGTINPQGLFIQDQRLIRRKMFRDPQSGR